MRKAATSTLMPSLSHNAPRHLRGTELSDTDRGRGSLVTSKIQVPYVEARPEDLRGTDMRRTAALSSETGIWRTAEKGSTAHQMSFVASIVRREGVDYCIGCCRPWHPLPSSIYVGVGLPSVVIYPGPTSYDGFSTFSLRHMICKRQKCADHKRHASPSRLHAMLSQTPM